MKILETGIQLFKYYKQLGDKSIEPLTTEELNYKPDEFSNSIGIIIQHLSGNMLSRWTDFLTTDGEKPTRNRDMEFEPLNFSKEEYLEMWSSGWDCLFSALEHLDEEDLSRIVYIRNEGHTAEQAIMRQVAHYSYHVGQIVLLAKVLRGENWVNLSIPKQKSNEFNQSKFSEEKRLKFFSKDL
ncbi:MAG: DUF1572 family protein [Saprospiraceae bacterium]|jgi:uncharacterized damage-inducible protein DinB|nr:DUF1572 family protein [Saprospiraceae bacterium]